MEETQSSPVFGDDRSRKTAETLCALRAQADQTLEGYRHRVSHLQAERDALPSQLQGQQECTACAKLREDLAAQLRLCAEQEAKCGALVDQLLAELQALESEHQEQLQQISRKFELALTDVHKLKRENAELHAELASRPVASNVEFPELLSLRSERDALAARLTQLKKAASQTVDTDVQQEITDLQRRFESAVDDLRQLKQENADLLIQLEAASTISDPADTGGTDWQSQKARLMAALDAEERGAMTPERKQGRATIEGTIFLTDQIVAAKDKELTQLRASLEARPAEEDLQVVEEIKQAVREEVFADNELIQTERNRLKEIQQEWQDKLRQAELEISVERAKLAREQSELAGKMASFKESSLDKIEDNGQPQRRWLSALGLRDDEEQDP
ncbi:MAG: hypothetical protein MK171_13260 [Pirellulales bacterium]|nr:hypothetical protein [Pirellulales bacterium]